MVPNVMELLLGVDDTFKSWNQTIPLPPESLPATESKTPTGTQDQLTRK